MEGRWTGWYAPTNIDIIPYLCVPIDLLEGLDDILGSANDGGNDDPSGSEDIVSEEEEEEELVEQDETSSDESDVANPEVDEDVDASGDESSDEIERSAEETVQSQKTDPFGIDLSPSASKYVPPHLRPGASTNDQLRTRLLRQLKGLINRSALIQLEPLHETQCW